MSSKNPFKRFHHIGIPTTESKPGEQYSSAFDCWTADVDGSRIGAQWHRFGENHPFHPIIAELPHIAFQVDNLEDALAGEEVIMTIHEPIPGFRSAMILDAGLPIELIETKLSKEQIENKVQSGDSIMRR